MSLVLVHVKTEYPGFSALSELQNPTPHPFLTAHSKEVVCRVKLSCSYPCNAKPMPNSGRECYMYLSLYYFHPSIATSVIKIQTSILSQFLCCTNTNKYSPILILTASFQLVVFCHLFSQCTMRKKYELIFLISKGNL